MRGALALLVVVLPASVQAYTLTHRQIGGDLVPLRWPASRQPVVFQIHDGTSPDLPNVSAGSDPKAAIESALPGWPAVADVSFDQATGPIAASGQDGANIISLADVPANRSAFEMAGGPAGLAIFFFDGNAQLTEADVIFNPDDTFTTTAETQEELNQSGNLDLEGVALHELGHAIGLDHTGVEAAVMWALSSLAQRTLDADDVSGARALYPLGGRGSIGGRVTVDGAPAVGAHVVAVSDAGIPVSTLTVLDGTYAIEALPPGDYGVYVEPLDGPHNGLFTDPCLTFGSLSGAGIYFGRELTTGFRTSFAPGGDVVSVGAGGTATADFDLAEETPTMNPAWIGPGQENGGFSSSVTALQIDRGVEQLVAVSGPGLDTVPDDGIAVLGAGTFVDVERVQRRSLGCNDQELPTLIFPVTIDADAPPGARTVLFEAGEEIAVLTGGLEVRGGDVPPTATPTPGDPTPTATPGSTACVGDCGADGAVTVDELVRGVNIALGNAVVDTCPAFDGNGDGQVTINELVQAVNAALAGCG